MKEMHERWGVFAWSTISESTIAHVNNAFGTQKEARDYAATLNRNAYDSVVICSEEHFDECWKLIGAIVVGG